MLIVVPSTSLDKRAGAPLERVKSENRDALYAISGDVQAEVGILKRDWDGSRCVEMKCVDRVECPALFRRGDGNRALEILETGPAPSPIRTGDDSAETPAFVAGRQVGDELQDVPILFGSEVELEAPNAVSCLNQV